MYNEIIIEAINYIKNNLEENLTVEKIARHCHFSKYHFNKLFKNEVGESVYSFIKRLRMEKSILESIVNNKQITEVASKYRYSSSNFSTAFKILFDESPKNYRDYYTESSIKKRSGHYANLSNLNYEYFQSKVNYVVIDEIEVLFKRFIGDYRNLNYRWEEFFDEFKKNFTSDSVQIEISYNDPLITDPNKCITDLCITTNEKITSKDNVQVIKGGKYAIYSFEGPYEDLFGIYQGLIGQWMVKSLLKFDLENQKIFSIVKKYDFDNNNYAFDIYIPYN